MTLGKVFFALEEARNFRDVFDSLRYTDDLDQVTYEISLSDCERLSEILDILLELSSKIEVGD